MNNFRLATLGGICLIAGVAVVIYFPALSGGFLIDDEALAESSIIKRPDGLFRIWCTTEPIDYWPVTNTLFWLEWRLWPAKPVDYHLVNLALHVIDALLVWAVLRQLEIPGAFLAAVLFTVHPVNVESVAWIAQGKNLLAMLFYMLSILAWLKASSRFVDGGVTIDQRKSPRLQKATRSQFICYFLSVLCFLLAMLSKGSVVILPLVLLLIAWWQGEEISFRLVRRIAPFFLVAVGLGLVNIWFQTHGATGSALHDVNFLQRLLGAGAVIWFYLYKALVPVGLLFVYPQWKINAADVGWWIPLLAALIVTGFLIWHRNGHWANWDRPVLLTWAYFCVALAPVMGFIGVGYMQYSLVADHYQHLAIISVVALFAAAVSQGGLNQVATRHGAARRLKSNLPFCAKIIAVTAAVLALAFLTRCQCNLYGNTYRLYQDAAEKNPDSWLVQYNLGNALNEIGQQQEALRRFQKALALNSNEPNVHNNLGNVLKEAGQIQGAIAEYRQAVKLKPSLVQAQYNLAAALAEAGKPEEAVGYYQQATRLEPDWAEAHYNLGRMLAKIGRRSEAVSEFQAALNAKPDYADAQAQLGLALLKEGQLAEAVVQLQRAAELDRQSVEVHNNLGIALKQSGKIVDAIEQYQQALRIDPKFAEAHNNLGNALLESDQVEAAAEHFTEATRLDPNYVQPWFGLAMAYQRANRPAEAIAAGKKASELARNAGQIELAQQIESWLTSYRARRSADNAP